MNGLNVTTRKQISLLDNLEKGFSLIEVMVTLALATILLLFAIPDYTEMSEAVNRRAAREIIDADVARARGTAIAEGARAVITVSALNSGYTVGVDYLPYNNPPAADDLVFATQLPDNVELSVSDTLVFDSRGYLVDSAGVPTSQVVTLTQGASVFQTGIVYSAGMLAFN